MPSAVIDLGTNTFHLLIAEQDASGAWVTLLKLKNYVKLAEDGILRIGEAPFQRALDTLDLFKKALDETGVPVGQVRAFGTAAIRTASNAPELLAEIEQRTGIRVSAISGDEEARLIYLGVRRAVPFPETGRVLIMDIGGGSVEFIIADRKQVLWQRSFPVGVAVLFYHFHQHDPISAEEVQVLEDFLQEKLTDLREALERFEVHTLVGASGTFDVIDLFLIDPADKPALYGKIPAAAFYPLCDMFLNSTLDERKNMPKLAPERMEMIVVAVVLVRFVLRLTGVQVIYTSEYALKEGVLEDLSDEW